MKKLLVLAAASAVLLCSCVSAPVAKGAGVKNDTGKAHVVDYKGSDLGADIPGWIMDAATGNYKNVKKAIGIDDDEKVWVISNRGTSLDFLKEWTDQMDARSQIASAIEQSIGDGIKADSMLTEEDKERAIQRVSLRMTDITLNGLDKRTDYWTYVYLKDKGSKKQTYFYNYYVVFTMPEAMWQKQLKVAMDDLSTYDDKSPNLRASIEASLNETLGIPAPAKDSDVADVPSNVEYEFE